MKMWALLIVAILMIGLFFGCTQTNTTQEVNITNDSEAIKTTNEVNSDISGINSALNEIDNTLIDKNQ